jgi:predicted RNA methylase
VINKASSDLTVGNDLEGRADILVSEIISSDLLAENVLDTFQDAHLRLLREGATVVPRAATAGDAWSKVQLLISIPSQGWFQIRCVALLQNLRAFRSMES